jgi:hypothetical protein
MFEQGVFCMFLCAASFFLPNVCYIDKYVKFHSAGHKNSNLSITRAKFKIVDEVSVFVVKFMCKVRADLRVCAVKCCSYNRCIQTFSAAMGGTIRCYTSFVKNEWQETVFWLLASDAQIFLFTAAGRKSQIEDNRRWLLFPGHTFYYPGRHCCHFCRDYTLWQSVSMLSVLNLFLSFCICLLFVCLHVTVREKLSVCTTWRHMGERRFNSTHS